MLIAEKYWIQGNADCREILELQGNARCREIGKYQIKKKRG